MKTKRILAWTLGLMLVLTSMPMIAFADTSPTELTEGEVRATKTIEDFDEEKGEAIVKLEVQGKDKVTELGADVILLVDNSGGMGPIGGTITYEEECGGDVTWKVGGFFDLDKRWQCNKCGERHGKSWSSGPSGPVEGNDVIGYTCIKLFPRFTTRMDLAKDASKAFASSVLADSKNSLAVIGFAGDAINKSTENFTETYNTIEAKIDNMEAKIFGATNYTKALKKAIAFSDSRANKDKPLYVVMMSDGAPGLFGGSPGDPTWNGIKQATTLKGSDYSATIYTVGIALSGNAGQPLKNLASLKEDVPMYQNIAKVTMNTDLQNVLDAIVGGVQRTAAGTNTVMTDGINLTEFMWMGFVNPSGDSLISNPEGTDYTDGKITWNIGNTSEEGDTIYFKVKLKDEYLIAGGTHYIAGGTYHTNTDVNLKYTNVNGDESNIAKGSIGDPYVQTEGTLSYEREGYTGVYDADYHGITVTAPEDATIMYGESEGEYYFAATPTYSDVGEYTVYYEITRDGYMTVTGSEVVKITPRPITITADSASKRYNGTPLTAPGWTENLDTGKGEGLLAGHEVTGVTVTGSRTDVGSSDNVATGGVISAPIEQENPQAVSVSEVEPIEMINVTPNYYITHVNGTLTVTRKSSGTVTPVIIPDEEVPGGPLLNMVDHYAYIQGDSNDMVRPEGNVTREEVAAVFFRLLDPDYRETIRSTDNNFIDMTADRWSAKHVSTLSQGNIITGYADGSFKPGEYITRAELAVIASKFDALAPTEENKFTDVAGHWAVAEINSAAEKGWINGYSDKTFKPNQYITRAEFVTLVNNVLERAVIADRILPEAKQFSDLKADSWYYEAMQEAINSHDYERDDDGFEIWKEIIFPSIEM